MANLLSSLWTNPILRGVVLFSIFRAVYGAGILMFTYFMATSETTPWWFSLVFLAGSMVFSRWLFRRLKTTWPNLFSPSIGEPGNQHHQTTP
jgi:hypothetical protein